MAIRYLDTFYTKRDRDLRVLCNRGLSGIDGVLSSAIGASLHAPHATLLIGDIAFLHDINALHLRRIPGADLTVVLMNNDGGGIFEILPQKGEECFERLFRTPHGVDFEPIVRGFGVPYVRVEDVETFSREYAKAQRQLGIRVIEVRSGSDDLAENYRRYC
jgi:2-succinyl-5-enolpyruvyl-6-hydroxy-3-cyclohexene-1-carboxylate synthase